MTRVLALDLAKNAGWAVVEGATLVDCGSWDLVGTMKTTGRNAVPLDTQHVILVQRLRGAILGVIDALRPDVVAVEREFGRGVGTRLLVSLYTAAQEAAYVANLPCMGIRLGDWRKYIHGTAGKSTDFYKAEALRLTPHAPDADAAEAALIGRYVTATATVLPVAAPATRTKARAA